MMQTRLQIAIFIIDDDESMRMMLNVLLHKHDIINYTIYSDPQELLNDLHKGVQMCVIDYNLKHHIYDGLGLMRKILEQNSYCKCIIISAYEDAKMIKSFLNAGAYKYITKGERDFSENLIRYIKDGIELISETFSFYTTILRQVKEVTNDLKLIKNG